MFETKSDVVQDVLELLILLPPPPECFDYKCATPHSVYALLEVEPRTSCVLHKHSTN